VPATAHVVAQAAVGLIVKEPEAGAHANTDPAIKEARQRPKGGRRKFAGGRHGAP